MRTHRGEKDVSLHGSLFLSEDETEGELGVSVGYFFTDIFQVGVEGGVQYARRPADADDEESEKEDTISGDADVYVDFYLPTREANPFEPFVGVLAGVYADKESASPIVGAKLGSNLYFTENMGVGLEYRLVLVLDGTELEHQLAFELFYQFD
jgi:outer membrane protein W